ncbi:hypothetical protein E8E11_004818 [Didymella keratinophila]|nr:hypothetical protein E8E11_004818 [Didymella keratinophila]
MGPTKRKHDATDALPTGIERYFTRPAKEAGTDSAKLQNRHGLRPHNRRSLLLDLPGGNPFRSLDVVNR